jgi:hypothetical protein
MAEAGEYVEKLGARAVVELTVAAFDHGFRSAVEEMSEVLGTPGEPTKHAMEEARTRHLARIREKTEREAGLR